MSRRYTMIMVSVGAHVGFGVALYANSIWGVDRLDPGKGPEASLAMAALPPPPSGGGNPSPEQLRKVEIKRVKAPELTQPKLKVTLEKPLTTGTPETGPAGPGNGPGPLTSCVGDGCGPIGLPPGDPPKVDPPVVVEQPKPKKKRIVAPTVLNALRTSGNTQISPSEIDRQAIRRDGRSQVIASLMVCVDESGTVSAADIVSSSKYPDYDARLVAGVRAWKYRPLLVDGQAVQACTSVQFNYTMH